MSIKLMNVAWTVAIPNASAKIVLLALADHANDEGTSCFPQIETICKKCGLTYRGVTKILEQLKTNGQITVVSGRGRHRSNNYKVHPDPTRKWEPRSYFKRGENRNETTRKWERGDTKIGTDEQENRNDVPTYPSVPIIEPSLTTNGTAPIESADAYSHFTQEEEDEEALALLKRLGPPSAPTTTPSPEPIEEDEEDLEPYTEEELFDHFEKTMWELYPPARKSTKHRPDFTRMLREIPAESRTQAWKALKAWNNSADWKREGGQYVPSILNFLVDKRWTHPPKTERVKGYDCL